MIVGTASGKRALRKRTRASRKLVAEMLLAIAILPCMAMLPGCAQSTVDDGGAEQQAEVGEGPEEGQSGSAESDGSLTYLSPEEAYRLSREKQCKMVDLQTLRFYRDLHIDGAANVPIGSISVQIRNFSEGDTVILYTTDGSGVEEAFEAMIEAGIPSTSIYAIEGGLDAWAAEGLPTAVLDKAAC